MGGSDFENIYKMCIGKIVKDMRIAGKYGEAEEYVNDGYVKLIESGKNISFNNLYSYSKQSLYRGEDYLIEQRPEFTKESNKECSHCKENKPIACFGVTENNNVKRRTIQPYCRECAKKYLKKYYEFNREQWTKKVRQTYRKEKKELHSNYIKKQLRNYGWKTGEITENTISFARKLIQKRRENKKVSLKQLRKVA